MDDFFQNAFNAVSGTDFEEIPVDIETFVTDPEFLGMEDSLSEYQYLLIKAVSQVYKKETLIALHGEQEGERRYREYTFREVIMQLGKGSGKDFTSVIAVCYIVYLCLCLKSPTKYFRNDSIDIVNIAINADQAQRVFFSKFLDRIKNSPWFDGKYRPGASHVQFDKMVNVYSGHSEREAYEGYNTLVIILDEISGFALENTTGHAKAKTSEAIYEWARGSVTSRNSRLGKVVMLSFPRFRDDWIQQKYDKSIAEKEVIKRQRTIKVDPDLPDGTEGNEAVVEWDEDHIIRYAKEAPYTFALKRPSWEVNPTKDLQEDYAIDFFRNYADALGRFACMPSDNTEDSFFKNKQAIEDAFVARNGVDEFGEWYGDFQPDPTKQYFIHVDLSKTHDRCAIAMAHVEKWVTIKVGDYHEDVHPVVKIDVVRWWKPSKFEPMDYKKVVDFIIALRRRGFKLKLTTFDRWQSQDTMHLLESQGINTDLLSVANKHYDDFLSTMYDSRLIGPKIPELIDELKQLRYIKDKVDHPRTGYKDLSDATCGAIYNAVTLTPPPANTQVEVLSYADVARRNMAAEQENRDRNGTYLSKGAIKAPPKQVPPDLAEYLDRFTIL
jgi:hypothetical protein